MFKKYKAIILIVLALSLIVPSVVLAGKYATVINQITGVKRIIEIGQKFQKNEVLDKAVGYVYNPTSFNSSSKVTFGTATTTNLYARNINTTLYADLFTGADIGAKINAAYAALPAAGGTIVVGAGSYNQSTNVVFGTNNKNVKLQCTYGSYLNFIGSGVAFTFDNGDSTYNNLGMSGCAINGPALYGNTTGIYLGGSNGFSGGFLDDITVTNFGIGINWTSNVYLFAIRHPHFNNNGKNMYVSPGATNSGENIQISDGTFSNWAGYNSPLNCIDVSTTNLLDIHFQNTSFDNCQIANNASTSAIQITIEGGHIENPSSTTSFPFIKNIAPIVTTGKNVISLTNVNFYQSRNTTGVPDVWITNNGTMDLTGVFASAATSSTYFATGTGVMINHGFKSNLFWNGSANVPIFTYLYNATPLSESSIYTSHANTVGGVSFVVGDVNNATDGNLLYSYKAGTTGSQASLGFNYYVNSAGATTKTYTSGNGWGLVYDTRTTTNAPLYINHVSTGGTVSTPLTIDTTGYVGIGTTTPLVPLQVTTTAANATTTVEFGKANQATRGTCLKMYNTAGVATYCLITGTTFSCSAVSCQ